MNKRRIGLFILISIILLTTIGGLIFYFTIGQQVNFTGFRGDGSVVDLTLPDGFKAEPFAEGLNSPRFMTFGPDGVLVVADRGNDRLVRLPDANNDGKADAVELFADNINSPHSVIYHDGAWYVGITSGVLRLTDTDGDNVIDEREVLVDDYPTSGSHSTRTVIVLPNGRLAVSIGSSCNVCEEDDNRRAAIVAYDSTEADNEQLFATGLRNAVGLAIHPNTGQLWATNNGRDLMGDDLPPEALYIVQEGANYGWPVCHNGDIIDPDMGFDGACEGVVSPVINMQAHSAPLGLEFYSGDAFPTEYHNDLFIAFHGSWNRSIPTGYKIVRLPLDEAGNPTGELEDFVTGWLDTETDDSFGRPVGIAFSPDGDMYISDDKGDFIYRVYYDG